MAFAFGARVRLAIVAVLAGRWRQPGCVGPIARGRSAHPAIGRAVRLISSINNSSHISHPIVLRGHFPLIKAYATFELSTCMRLKRWVSGSCAIVVCINIAVYCFSHEMWLRF